MTEYVTPDNYEKMKEKLAALKGRRAKISKTIGEARDEGDLKENAGYHAAKEEQGLNEARIRDLEAKIESVTVVAAKDMPKSDAVTLGSTVRIKALDTGKVVEYKIVPEIEADVLEDKISTDSPLGGALFGARIGETIEFEAPRGLVKYQVLEIR
ncbi:MAG: transcription elongation factor GreA [Candidatus Margulisbacteria bacterium]|jgi:transcription elongation factor GreA|nr:transcription elongation factor GreA [Candidatus Margulisiibacteriota bacterium]